MSSTGNLFIKHQLMHLSKKAYVCRIMSADHCSYIFSTDTSVDLNDYLTTVTPTPTIREAFVIQVLECAENLSTIELYRLN